MTEEKGRWWCGIEIGSRARRRKKKEKKKVSGRKRRDERGETNQRLVETGTRVVPGTANRHRRPPLGSGPIHRSGPGPSRARSREDRGDPCQYILSLLSPPAPLPSSCPPFARNVVCKRHGPMADAQRSANYPRATWNLEPARTSHAGRGRPLVPRNTSLEDRVPGRRWSTDGKINQIGTIFLYSK